MAEETIYCSQENTGPTAGPQPLTPKWHFLNWCHPNKKLHLSCLSVPWKRTVHTQYLALTNTSVSSCCTTLSFLNAARRPMSTGNAWPLWVVQKLRRVFVLSFVFQSLGNYAMLLTNMKKKSHEQEWTLSRSIGLEWNDQRVCLASSPLLVLQFLCRLMCLHNSVITVQSVLSITLKLPTVLYIFFCIFIV